MIIISQLIYKASVLCVFGNSINMPSGFFLLQVLAWSCFGVNQTLQFLLCLEMHAFKLLSTVIECTNFA